MAIDTITQACPGTQAPEASGTATSADAAQCDIRERSGLDHGDVSGLNFIRDTGRFRFRRHFRSGLRSHVMEVLRAEDLVREQAGEVVAGLRRFPRARPVAMLRLFRMRFDSAGAALAEVGRLRVVERYLGRAQVAVSHEFIVAYRWGCRYTPMLCGLQEFVCGEPLDPWRCRAEGLTVAAREGLVRFVSAVRCLVAEEGLIPDLAGVGNLLLTATGGIKLVDINNISALRFIPAIPLDDKGYPVGDKSVEALFRLERDGLGRAGLEGERLYRHFLDPDRCQAVARLHHRFHGEEPRATFARGLTCR